MHVQGSEMTDDSASEAWHLYMHMHISDCTLPACRELFVPGCALVWHCTKNREYGYVESVLLTVLLVA